MFIAFRLNVAHCIVVEEAGVARLAFEVPEPFHG